MADNFREQFMAARKDGMCQKHGVPLLEYQRFKNKKTGLSYCPKCREEAAKQQNEQRERSLREGGEKNDGSLQGETQE